MDLNQKAGGHQPKLGGTSPHSPPGSYAYAVRINKSRTC